MEYSINMGMWSSVFAVPTKITDKYMKDANELQIKVILWALRYSQQGLNISEMSQKLNFTEEKIIGALEYWKNLGLISSGDSGIVNYKAGNENSIKENDLALNKRDLRHVRYQKPNSLYIANRMQTSKEIDFMMQEAQVILGRPLSNGDSAVLLMLHDNDGLPVDVVLMLLQYAVSVGKTGMKYIEKIGINWSNEGIDNLEKAEKKIISLNKINMAWKKFESIIGIEHRAPTSREEETVIRWMEDWNYNDELIKEAYERCVNANGKYVLRYMDSIIKRWHTQGIFTIEQAVMENKKYRYKTEKTKDKNHPSYNIEEYENYNILDYLSN